MLPLPLPTHALSLQNTDSGLTNDDGVHGAERSTHPAPQRCLQPKSQENIQGTVIDDAWVKRPAFEDGIASASLRSEESQTLVLHPGPLKIGEAKALHGSCESVQVGRPLSTRATTGYLQNLEIIAVAELDGELVIQGFRI